MARPIREHFASPMSGVTPMTVSPALMNLLAGPTLTTSPDSLQVDTLGREQDLNRPKCPKCERCPDMSQYIRLDEIPCWNCSLP
jgi:hypothetical protein